MIRGGGRGNSRAVNLIRTPRRAMGCFVFWMAAKCDFRVIYLSRATIRASARGREGFVSMCHNTSCACFDD